MSEHLKIEQPLFADRPHGWLQWKGTDACIDLHCACGAHIHFDGSFLYYWRCPYCSRVWEMGTHIPMYEVPEDRQAELIASCSILTPVNEDDVAVEEPRVITATHTKLLIDGKEVKNVGDL